jgi:hypothetical protein
MMMVDPVSLPVKFMSVRPTSPSNSNGLMQSRNLAFALAIFLRSIRVPIVHDR